MIKIDTYQERYARIKTIPDLHREMVDAKRITMSVRLHAKSRMPIEHRHCTAFLKMHPELNKPYLRAKAVEQQLERNFLRIKADLREDELPTPIPKAAIGHIRKKARSYFNVLGRLPDTVTYDGLEYKCSAFMALVSDIPTTSY
ncbi:hypothetical protein [Pseudoalteromonas sp. SK20]|uniref:hypothetical protein n=1 Tax=Pseudoalteromonas sp. SK20 TaxID=1938367 RepID=UPI00097593AE|nr:hypothetical protein [Pseudoalteromonas sp. SK20]